ncbi:gas vesicle protein [Streptomyces lydicus]|uniref:gas vesicle protein n=1 Tax=Streptomyces lydicus TaxID=47763 RepID=UPI003D6882D2
MKGNDPHEAAFTDASHSDFPYPDVPRAAASHVTDPSEEESLAGRQIALIDLLDRLLNGGAVLTGDVVLSIAEVDLVHINLRAVIRSVTPDSPAPW